MSVIATTTPDSGRPTIANRSFIGQALILELMTLRSAPPPGVYVAPLPHNPFVWTGVLFVLKGPYSEAIVRFSMHFPHNYPLSPPVIVFKTDMFHPLVTPIPAFGLASAQSDSSNACLASSPTSGIPGSFCLKQGFPGWFGGGSTGLDKQSDVSVFEMLDYMRTTFDDEHVLTAIPLSAAVNPSAFHAWRAHKELEPVSEPVDSSARTLAGWADRAGMIPGTTTAATTTTATTTATTATTTTTTTTTTTATTTTPRKAADWNWDGVWQERVDRAISASSSEAVLFGNSASTAVLPDDPILFDDVDDDTYEQLMAEMAEMYPTAVVKAEREGGET